jgi:hypothetical protein
VSLAFLVGTAVGDWVDSLAALVLVALGYGASRLAAGPAGAEESG